MQFELGVNYMQKIDRAILVALNHQTPYDVTKASIDELEELAKALEIKTVDKVIQTLSSIDQDTILVVVKYKKSKVWLMF